MSDGASMPEEVGHEDIMRAIPGVGGNLIELALHATHVVPLVGGFTVFLLNVKASFEDIVAIAGDAKQIIDWATEEHALLEGLHESLDSGGSPVADVLRSRANAAARSVEELFKISNRIRRDNSLKKYLRAGSLRTKFKHAKEKVEAMRKQLEFGLKVVTCAGVHEANAKLDALRHAHAAEIDELKRAQDAKSRADDARFDELKQLILAKTDSIAKTDSNNKKEVLDFLVQATEQESPEAKTELTDVVEELYNGDADAATTKLETASKTLTASTAALFHGGIALFLKNLDAAIELLLVAVNQDRQMGASWFMLSMAYQRKHGPCQDALDALYACIEVDESSLGYNALGLLLLRLHKYDEAEKIYRKAIVFNKSDALTHYGLAQLLETDHFNNVTEAEREYRAAIDCDPKVPTNIPVLGEFNLADAHLCLALLLLKKGDGKGAEEHFRRNLLLEPAPRPVTYYALGRLLLERGKVSLAEKALGDASRLDPEDEEYQQLHAAIKENARAEETFREAIRLGPNDASAYFKYGNFLHARFRNYPSHESLKAATKMYENSRDRIHPNDKSNLPNIESNLRKLTGLAAELQVAGKVK
jgi:tetratricopeptide (TPR) repeat protein